MDDVASINLGSVYETVVAQEPKAHGFNLYYYDNKKLGEVDYLIDDREWHHLSADLLHHVHRAKRGGRQIVVTRRNKGKLEEKNIKQKDVLSY